MGCIPCATKDNPVGVALRHHLVSLCSDCVWVCGQVYEAFSLLVCSCFFLVSLASILHSGFIVIPMIPTMLYFSLTCFSKESAYSLLQPNIAGIDNQKDKQRQVTRPFEDFIHKKRKEISCTEHPELYSSASVLSTQQCHWYSDDDVRCKT